MTTDRDERGRFLAGHKFSVGKGRPKRYASYLGDMEKMVTSADWKEVVGEALERAKGGDRHARAWLSDYLMGKPIQRVDVADVTEGGPVSLSLEEWLDVAAQRRADNADALREAGIDADQLEAVGLPEDLAEMMGL